MTYIKLLTALTALALLTACGGGGTADSKTDDNTGGGSATDCKANAFHADCLTNNAPALLLRQTMCLADSTTDDSCGAVIEGVCMDDPFNSNATCTADTYLPARIAECIKGGMGDDDKCTTITTDTEKNTMVTSCLTNPFDIVCQTSVTDFVPSFEQARMNRLDFCDNNANVANDFCTGNNVVIICNVDPFTAICLTGTTYLSPRITDCIKTENTEAEKCNTLLSNTAMNTTITNCLTNPFTDTCASNADFMTHATTAQMNREVFCDMAGNNTKALCMGENLMGVCDIDSFNVICLTDATYDPNRQTRQVQCVADSTAHTNCPAALRSLDGVVDTTDITGITTPTGVIDHADLPATIAVAIANTDISSFFLSVGANGIPDTTGLAISISDNTKPTPLTLSRAGDAMDGVTYVRGIIEGESQSFVGLLPSTNLGAPLPSNTADATWEGSYYMFLNTATNATNDITFNIDFGAGEIDGTDTRGNNITTFDLDFTATGVITGSVSLVGSGLDDTAPVRGLIGEQGLVGGFANTDGGTWASNLYGGFVADNPDNPAVVDYYDWLASFAAGTVPPATPDAPRKSQFLAGTETGFADGANVNIRNLLGTQTVDNPVETIEFANADAAAGGVAFFGGRLYNGGMSTTSQFHYAGVLAGTNLGAPITEIIPTAVRWTGKIQSYSKSNSAAEFLADNIADFGLDITFNGTSGTLKEFFRANLTNHFFINGTFDVNGIITGTVELGNKSPNGNTINTATNLYSPGTLSGIIGQDGLVGVYHSGHVTLRAHSNNDDRYSGGFIASPPAQ